MKRVVVRSLIVAAAVSALVGGCGKGKEEKAAGDVLAKVNAKVITMDDFRKEQKKLPPYIKGSLETAEGKRQFLDNLVTRELILQKAEKSGLDKDEAVTSKLEEVKKTLMMEALLKKEIEGKSAFTEREAEEYYNSHKDEFKEGEKIRISHIMVKTEKEANDIHKKLEKKESFEGLAKKYSVGATASKGGELGYIERGTVIPEFEDAAFKLKKAGDISPVIKAGAGYHIIKLLDRKDADVQPFDKVKDKIVETQTKKKQKEMFENYVNSLKKEAKLEINDSLLKDETKKEEKPSGEKKEEAPAKEEKGK